LIELRDEEKETPGRGSTCSIYLVEEITSLHRLLKTLIVAVVVCRPIPTKCDDQVVLHERSAARYKVIVIHVLVGRLTSCILEKSGNEDIFSDSGHAQ
jgi:hypothetical protein